MERYHIFKLGLAITFYAIYFIRPITTNDLKLDSTVQNKTKFIEDEYVYYQGVQGKPGVDFPVLSHIPRTVFTCKNLESGYYADVDTQCQVFHICEDGRKISFLCPNGTIFQQTELICEWWFKVNCTDSFNYYEDSAELLREGVARRKASRRVSSNNNDESTRKFKTTAKIPDRVIATSAEADNRVDNAPNLKIRVSTRLGGNNLNRASQNQNDYASRNDQRGRNKYTQSAPQSNKIKQDVEIISHPSQDGHGEDNYVSLSVSQPSSTRTRNRQVFSAPTNPPPAEVDVRKESPSGGDSDESQIPQETASFYKNTFNSINQGYKPTSANPYPNHRQTYSDLKEPKYYSTKITSAISSVTPHYLTTQPINNGRPYVGSQVGPTVRIPSTTKAPPTTTEAIINSVPSNLFNVGKTGKSLKYITKAPVIIEAPKNRTLPAGRFNLGHSGNTIFTTIKPVVSTKRTTDYATVYGTFAKTASTTPSSARIFDSPPAIHFSENFADSFKYSPETNTSTKGLPYLPLSTTKSVDTGRSSPTPTPIYSSSTEINSALITTLTPPIKSNSDVLSDRNVIERPRPFQLSRNTTNNLVSPVTNFVTPPNPTYRISSASPFKISTLAPTQPTPFLPNPSLPSTFENVDNMINALAEMAKANDEDYTGDSPRPGLVIPPSAGPQTLHTLAVYFANALDGIAAGKEEEEHQEDGVTESLTHVELEKKRLTALLTKMTMNRYNELFNKEEEVEITTVTSSDDLEGQHSKNAVQTPRIRQLAKVFTQALSSYLDDPATFRKVLEEVRPTEPPLQDNQTLDDTENDEELLNFSDGDKKSSYPPVFPALPSISPTWGYLIAYNKSQLDVKNSLNSDGENLQGADSQSFVSQFNKLKADEDKKALTDQLPEDHWTTSPGVTKLWKTAFSFDPYSINDNFGSTTPSPQEPSEIQYELRALPKLNLNSTQVHGILIDFMNTTKSDESNRLQRILRKLNTTENDFLVKMKEIESNPLTRRLILLLISECGANVTKAVEDHQKGNQDLSHKKEQVLDLLTSYGELSKAQKSIRTPIRSSSNFKEIIDSSLDDDSEDARALQLLNSLYSIASKFGK